MTWIGHRARSFFVVATIAVGAAISPARPSLAAVLQVPSTYATIGQAITAAAPGDTIVVAAGTYSPSVNGETFPISIGKNDLLLLGAGASASILDAEQTAGVIRHTATSGGRVTGFTITGGWTSAGAGVRVLSGNVEIDNNLVRANAAMFRGSGIFAGGAGTAPWIHHNVVWECFDTDVKAAGDPHGIQIVEGSTALVEHNLVGRGDSNSLLYDTGAAPIIRHNIFFENGIDGLRGRGICAFGDSTAVIAHNLFHGNVLADLLVAGAGDVTAAEANDIDPDDGIYGNVSGDPLFVNADALDFHLMFGSPAIDAGDPNLPFDPDGTIADIGPYFFPQGASEGPAVAGGSAFGLRPNAPNPFSRTTQLHFDVPRDAPARLTITDVTGRIVRRFSVLGETAASWDGRDGSGRVMNSGVYFVRLTAPGVDDTRKVTLVR